MHSSELCSLPRRSRIDDTKHGCEGDSKEQPCGNQSNAPFYADTSSTSDVTMRIYQKSFFASFHFEIEKKTTDMRFLETFQRLCKISRIIFIYFRNHFN